MERITISLDPALAKSFDDLVARHGYSSRSEAIRDLLRREVDHARQKEEGEGACVAALSYLYNHHERELAERLTTLQHDHHDLTVATMHVHLDHDNCIECAMLKGPTTAVRTFADAIISQRGVSYGSLNLISAEVSTARHAHGHSHEHPHDTGHVHYRPRR